MAFFILAAPYDQCLASLFQQPLGYPNFYRLSELLPSNESYQNLTLLAAPDKEKPTIESISARINALNMKCLQFGEDIEPTAFYFDHSGKCLIQPQFKQALHQAVDQFLKN